MSDEVLKSIGKKITGEGYRDAIHVAISTVTCIKGETLIPGEHIGVYEDGTFGKYPVKKIGIVDPFLPPGTIVVGGEKCYVFLYPGSLTSLRHHWEHPST